MSTTIEFLSRKPGKNKTTYFAITPYIQVKWGLGLLEWPIKKGRAAAITSKGTIVMRRAICFAWLFWSIRITWTTIKTKVS